MHLAQINIARMLAPMDSPVMADFVANLDRINALAEAHEGFVWRLKDETNNATSLQPFPDDMLIINMSVWASPEQLKTYAYQTAHAEIMKRRREWFEKHAEAFMALWWIPEGHLPTLEEARERLTHLQVHGDTPFAFTFRKIFAPENTHDATRQTDEQMTQR